GHTSLIPDGWPICKHPRKPAAISPPPEAQAASLPIPAEPCPGPYANSFHPPAHSRSRLPKLAHASRAQPCNEPQNRLNSTMKVREVELLIRSMKIVVRQSKAHHH